MQVPPGASVQAQDRRLIRFLRGETCESDRRKAYAWTLIQSFIHHASPGSKIVRIGTPSRGRVPAVTMLPHA